MAVRPWVTPDDVRNYTVYNEVKNRTAERLATDIYRAEQYVITYTRNGFSDMEKHPVIPEPVRTAVILIAEMYAFNVANTDTEGGAYKSRTFDDYSYTLRDTDSKLDNLSLGPLLDEFVLDDITGRGITMKIRKL